jgi:histidinol-phosphatase (PHP family)
MEEFVRFAIAKGLRKYGFSSHAPLPFLTKWTMLEDDFADYEMEFHRLKEKYAKEIELFIGLEVDYIHGCSDIKNSFFSDKKLDYTIGSIHYLDKLNDENEYWTIDGGFVEFDNGLNLLYGGDIRLATKSFFETTVLMIEKGGFDIVGHMDKITMHGLKYDNFKPQDNWFADLVTPVFELIKSKDLILEINTKSFTEKGLTFPHQHFFPLINEMGIKIVLNSDCHYPTNIADGFVPVSKLLKQAGFNSSQQLSENGWQSVEFDIVDR